jgi:hypothetical protein
MARRFGSAMISNTDSTLLVYSAEHMLVKVYKGTGRPGNDFSRRAGMHRLMRFWRVRFRALTKCRPSIRPYNPAINFATNAAQSAMRSMRILSFAACAPSPTAPRPSSVGMPRVAVKFPSEPRGPAYLGPRRCNHCSTCPLKCRLSPEP